MNTLTFLAGLGAGAFVASMLFLWGLYAGARGNKEERGLARQHNLECLAELKRRNELLAEQNAILSHIDAPDSEAK